MAVKIVVIDCGLYCINGGVSIVDRNETSGVISRDGGGQGKKNWIPSFEDFLS